MLGGDYYRMLIVPEARQVVICDSITTNRTKGQEICPTRINIAIIFAVRKLNYSVTTGSHKVAGAVERASVDLPTENLSAPLASLCIGLKAALALCVVMCATHHAGEASVLRGLTYCNVWNFFDSEENNTLRNQI